ncbi:MAG: saccharopine dehydrogenase NADP-binding domain-containing protein [Hymenobacteraceae bacterium]|nr:saccharopine dehydrogenase NADP-binding domain-containing protein [Hymenobacteraceae bacterium]MDX5395011.1 saccharopine dehydrogenase NADP-binding domain-containing protein [Hymenobacteraceae bacterium]MDX5444168.1 saccharopine dehydrogenase NADP-binding domain-containing protein [Hymenobacteraceae bacterium]MDX5511043.1 saccharopine dehydrogenase NADP-binding domain-containing protein [Hymenobacteraceae bacterium]
MKQILLLGAGRSASSLINYLLKLIEEKNWQLTIGDVAITHLPEHLLQHPQVKAIEFNIHHEEQVRVEVSEADLVISLLPAAFHKFVAAACLMQQKNLITASYVSPEIREMHQQAKTDNLIFLMECGLDPGIDHMSAMQVIHELQEKGAQLKSFKSYTGGLIAPESDNNPWHYKITWNPRNVVLAGQGVAKYLKEGQFKYIPYHQLFKRTDRLQVLEFGEFDGYANRDSLSYRQPYGLDNIPTILRGTLRRRGYCQSWNALVQLGLTDDSYTLENAHELTYHQLTESFLPAFHDSTADLRTRLAIYLNLEPDSEEIQNLEWLGLFSDEKIGLEKPTPAQVLEKIVVQKWKLQPGDKDMIVMQHLFEYELQGKEYLHTSSMVVLGDDAVQTGMAKTVGLPVGIAAKLILEGKVNQKGVIIPTSKELYEPILEELKEYGINFVEEVKEKQQAN